MRSARHLTCGAIVAAFAFTLYHATLVPGLDLGDSGAFQVGAGTKLLTPRQGYPLYFAIITTSAKLAPDDPARAVNLVSAVLGALAAGAVTLLAASLAESALAGVFSGLLFAGSYTFWSQSVTAEVYTLHILCVALTLLALRAWAARPSLRRLGAAFAVYAISFGNHLSMILLAPSLVVFIAAAHPSGWRGLFEPRTVVLATAMAVVGASQYLWNIAGMLAMPDVPATTSDMLKAFWFDVTKTDWRESMVMATPAVMLPDRLAMYWFDLRQQFGVIGILFSLAGVVWLVRRSPREHERSRGSKPEPRVPSPEPRAPSLEPGADALLLLTAFFANWLFAFTYNVGDVHVFFLPSHLIVALFAGCGVAACAHGIARSRGRAVVAACCAGALALPIWRTYETFPAVDRSDDRRAERILTALTEGITIDRAILGVDLNWQLHNGLLYFARYKRPDLPYFRTADRMLAFPFLVDANLDAGRRVYLSADAARRVTAAFGSLYTMDPDSSNAVDRVAERALALPAGTPYVLCILTPPRDRPLDPAVPGRLVSMLTGRESDVPLDGYAAVAGLKGGSPVLQRFESRPFRASVELAGRQIMIRMDAWLAYDTIRRAAFGHVIADHRHALAIERGISFIAWPESGGPVAAYEASLYSPQPRFIVHPSPAE